MKKMYIALVAIGILAVGASAYFLARPSGANDREERMENVAKVVEFLEKAGIFYIATMDGDRPRVRPFGVALSLNGRLSICTGARKNVSRQIAGNPAVEISAFHDGRWIRISGILSDDSTEANRKAFFAAAPNVADIYKGRENEFKVFGFKEGVARIEDFSGILETLDI